MLRIKYLQIHNRSLNPPMRVDYPAYYSDKMPTTCSQIIEVAANPFRTRCSPASSFFPHHLLGGSLQRKELREEKSTFTEYICIHFKTLPQEKIVDFGTYYLDTKSLRFTLNYHISSSQLYFSKNVLLPFYKVIDRKKLDF